MAIPSESRKAACCKALFAVPVVTGPDHHAQVSFQEGRPLHSLLSPYRRTGEDLSTDQHGGMYVQAIQEYRKT